LTRCLESEIPGAGCSGDLSSARAGRLAGSRFPVCPQVARQFLTGFRRFSEKQTDTSTSPLLAAACELQAPTGIRREASKKAGVSGFTGAAGDAPVMAMPPSMSVSPKVRPAFRWGGPAQGCRCLHDGARRIRTSPAPNSNEACRRHAIRGGQHRQP